MRVVAALGGNALLRRGEPLDLPKQQANARVAAPLDALGAESDGLIGYVLAQELGNGGVPVARAADGSLRGVEAVVDKDLTAALLTEAVGVAAIGRLGDAAAVLAGAAGTSVRRPVAVAAVSATSVVLATHPAEDHGVCGETSVRAWRHPSQGAPL